MIGHTHAYEMAGGAVHSHDVENLWAATESLPTIDLPIVRVLQFLKPSSIKVKDEWDRIQEADLSYPIIFHTTNGIVDGWHRVIKATMNGQETILAKIIEEYPSPDNIYADWEEYLLDHIEGTGK